MSSIIRQLRQLEKKDLQERQRAAFEENRKVDIKKRNIHVKMEYHWGNLKTGYPVIVEIERMESSLKAVVRQFEKLCKKMPNEHKLVYILEALKGWREKVRKSRK